MLRKWLAGLLALLISLPSLLYCGASAQEEAALEPIRDKWALIVGISSFKSKSVPKLQYAAKDAADFYRYLVNEANFDPSHVRILLNEEATERRVLSELGEKFLPNLVQPGDLVVVYFSTHGSPAHIDRQGKNYLVAYDSEPDELFTTGIEMKRLLESLKGTLKKQGEQK